MADIESSLFGPHYTVDSPSYDEATHSIRVVFAASQGRDRGGDFLEVGGIDTTSHRLNPVAYLDHGYKFAGGCKIPIGKCVDPDGNYTVTIDEEKGTAEAVVYLAYDVPEFVVPEQCFELYKQGVLRAGSIGYIPTEQEDIGKPGQGYHIKACELTEVSLVGIPMNADCVARSINGKALDPALLKHLPPEINTDMDEALAKRLESLEALTKSLETAHKSLESQVKSLIKSADGDAPADEVKDVLEAVKGHLEEAAEHADTPDDLREAHKHFAKAIGESLEAHSDEPDAGSRQELVKACETHLRESAGHEEQGKVMAAAHEHFADKCAACVKLEEPEENLSPEQEEQVMKSIEALAQRLDLAELKIRGPKGKY